MCAERISGFTLVEVMIAVAVFAIIILAIGQAAMMGVIASNEVKEQTNILLGCQQVMEQCLFFSPNKLIEQNGSRFSLRVGGPESDLVEGGVVVVNKDLNGDGDTKDFREGRDDAVRVALYYKKAESDPQKIFIQARPRENLFLERVITLQAFLQRQRP